MAATIHSTAIVDPGATIGEGVEIGPYCCIGPRVVLADEVVLRSHVVVGGITEIGSRTEIFPFASIGLEPQDLKYKGEESRLVVGTDNRIREYVTFNPGTEGGGMLTQVGNGCLFMVGAHVAHDCRIGDHVIMANNATLAGHVEIGDYAIIGGLSAVHQFVRIGAHAMVGGMTGVDHDVIPYGAVMGERGRLTGLNLIGVRRRGFSKSQIAALRSAYRMLFTDNDGGTLSERVVKAEKSFADDFAVKDILEFIRFESPRGLTPSKPDDGA
jgi:UDP-N-acetylglucosamine acyltransferase